MHQSLVSLTGLIMIIAAVAIVLVFVYSLFNAPGAAYASIGFQFAVAICGVFAFLTFKGFEQESLRGTLSNPVSGAIQIVSGLVALVPLVFALRSLYFLSSPRGSAIETLTFLGVTAFCALLIFGFAVLNELLAPKVFNADRKIQIETLKKSAKAGNGRDACKLATLKTPDSDETFSFCRTYIDSAPAPDRLATLRSFTEGASFITRSNQAVVPRADQSWFLKVFFRELIEIPNTALHNPFNDDPNGTFDDLLSVGNLLNSLLNPPAWDLEVLRDFVKEDLPKIESRYKARLTAAGLASQSLVIGQDGFVNQTSAGYTSKAESAFNNANWFRRSVLNLKAVK